jgi:transcriptional regulator with XRE-family HTH domain
MPRRTILRVSGMAGINPTAFGELERGRANTTYAALLRVAQALGVYVAELLRPRLSAMQVTWTRHTTLSKHYSDHNLADITPRIARGDAERTS